MKKVIIIVPNYKSELDEREEISLRQLLRVFNQYEICFVMPEGLEFDARRYDARIRKEFFSARAFQSTRTYNKLVLSSSFYYRFRDYEYMLICQLDVFVFKDCLDYFCSLGYAYIGAPWLEGIYYYRDKDHIIWNVGNGGMSLRNTQASIELLNNKQDEMLQFAENEDFVFSIQDSDSFKVAPLEIAVKFAAERDVRECFRLNHGEKPFGCHAWWTYDLCFLKEYIEEYGYTVREEWVKAGNSDELNRDEYKRIKKTNEIYRKGFTENYVINVLHDNGYTKDKKIAIWGTGAWGNRMTDFLLSNDYSVDCYLDNSEKKTDFRNLPVYKLNDILGQVEGYYIIVAVNQSQEIEIQCKTNGLRQGIDFILLQDILLYLNKYVPI